MNFERLVQRTAATLLMSMICLISLAQSRTVSGVVLDSRGDPVIGANIRVVSDASIGTITDLDGKFSLAVPGTAKQLEISFIGMQTQTVSIVAGQPVHVTLAEDAEILDEVVVIGYQTVKRKDLTGSVASVSGEQIAAMPVANAAQALQGKLAGVNVTTQDGRPDAAVSIRVRGGGSISQSNDPLVLIDGVSGSLSDIPGDQIESIDVLKDASSTAIYGARGADGVAEFLVDLAAYGTGTVFQDMVELFVFSVDIRQEMFRTFGEVQDGLEVDDLCGGRRYIFVLV